MILFHRHPICWVWLGVVLLELLSGAKVEAKSMLLRVGTLAPRGSTWDFLLRQVAQEWRQLSEGRVVLRIFPNGELGDEGQMLRRVRQDHLDGVAITGPGLQEVSSVPLVISAPMVLQSDEDFVRAIDALAPDFTEALQKKGYAAMGWTNVGPVKFFSTTPFSGPASTKGLKLFAWDGPPDAYDAWNTVGFRPVVLRITDVPYALESKVIEVVTQPPMYILTSGAYQIARNMVDVRWSTLFGVLLIKRSKWEQLPENLRTLLIGRLTQLTNEFNSKVAAQNQEAEAILVKRNVRVLRPSKTELEQWQTYANQINDKLVRSGVLQRSLFDKLHALLKNEGR